MKETDTETEKDANGHVLRLATMVCSRQYNIVTWLVRVMKTMIE